MNQTIQHTEQAEADKLLSPRPPTGLQYHPCKYIDIFQTDLLLHPLEVRTRLQVRFDREGKPVKRSILGGAIMYEDTKTQKARELRAAK